uniref:Sex-regulated protein janus-A n=3 Tax=Timema TaxID=61471 RepID=A0A7R9AM48_TIMSH|nr:unnamed protein product [Timema shepardi]CAD7403348.1 unnamed protein product [Timema poppensis]CAD7569464.1 unnamed protein product [Timema californicum]
MSKGKADSVADTEIDLGGTFKYVLINVFDKSSGEEHPKMIVRGFKWAEYHADIYDNTAAKLQKLGLDTECLGGGRIIHDSENKRIKVFGYSIGFGRADHELTVGVLKKNYPDYEITWSNEGY